MYRCSPDISKDLREALEAKDYFRFRDIYRAGADALDEKQGLYWEAVYWNLFGREYRSTVAASKYLKSYGDRDEDSGEMLYITAVNRLRRGRYAAAAATYRRLLRLHREGMDDEELEEALGNLAVCRALRNVPPQRVEHNGTAVIPTETTSFGHITAGVSAGLHRGNFLIDTGANFSTVTRTACREMGLREIPSGIEVGTSTGVRIECSLAWAPQLSLGGITVRNAVFIIMEDAQLTFPELDYRMEGIIGLPVLRGLGGVSFRAGHIRVGNVRIPSDVDSNMCLEGLMPLVEVVSGGERLRFTMDTGANQSEYSFDYYRRHSERLESLAREYNGLRGGGGGVVRSKTLMLTDEPLAVAGRELRSPAMNVIRQDYEFSRGKDGNLGLDALMSRGGFSLSFERMVLWPAGGRGGKQKQTNE